MVASGGIILWDDYRWQPEWIRQKYFGGRLPNARDREAIDRQSAETRSFTAAA